MSSHARRRGLASAIVGLAAIVSTPSHSAPGGQPTPEMANVPYAGCSSDGQLGPQSPPKQSKPTPRAPIAIASRLTYYASINNGVLGPRGWHCFSLYGSSGTTVLVSPEPIDPKRALDTHFKLRGDGIEFGYLLSGTSGRFEVAQVSAAFFPSERDFVAGVAKEEKDIGIPFDLSGKAFRNDRILNRTEKSVRLRTPAGKQGWGTRGRMAANRSPIEGLAALVVDGGETDLIELNIRLPRKDLDLVPVIQSVAEANHGAPLSATPLQNLPEEGKFDPRRPR